ncbi:ABC transporter permease [Gorillibacterium massiliense]|uniref:ABC transporter permease n=1 Tax=Gorillibacterium massiliense TaxID=1280390 RepID=UPI0004BA45B1|nr:ABC transporter permease subunit [Gorillibacterium massiliense]
MSRGPLYSVSTSMPATHRKHSRLGLLFRQRYLLLMSLPFVVWFIVFSYFPLAGWVMAFQNYKPNLSFSEQKWVGFKYFSEVFHDERFYTVLRNTFVIGLCNIVFSLLFSVLLAVLINEVRNKWFKRSIQTMSYLPHFVSWVVVVSIFYTVLSPYDGIVNRILMTFGFIHSPVAWMGEGKLFWGIITVAQVWKEMGWNSIIYLAAITSIDQELYEASEVDGANRLRKIWHITLPGIRTTILILLVLNIGNLMSTAASFDATFLMRNPLTLDYSETIPIYAYNYGIGMQRYSVSTAISMFNTAISLLLLFTANRASRRFSDGDIL